MCLSNDAYEEANDVNHLKYNPVIKSIIGGRLASQPTISRFENALDKQVIFNVCVQHGRDHTYAQVE